MTAFVHEALLYRDDPGYLAGTIPLIEDALAAGRPVLVAVPHRNGELIRGRLGGRAQRVRFLDITIDGRNPSRIIPAVFHSFVEEHPDEYVQIVGEPVWPGRSDLEYPACVQHEALVNTVFAGTPAALRCAYDARRLEPETLSDAGRTHPVLVISGEQRPSRLYTEPSRVAAAFNRPLSDPPLSAALMIFDCVDDLPNLREFVGKYAIAVGLVPDRVVDLQVAANELATNTIRHAGGPGVARIWTEGDSIVCDISDGGHIGDPLVGRIPPSINSEGGRGLLLTNYLCDLVRLHTTRGATSVRVYMRRDNPRT